MAKVTTPWKTVVDLTIPEREIPPAPFGRQGRFHTAGLVYQTVRALVLDPQKRTLTLMPKRPENVIYAPPPPRRQDSTLLYGSTDSRPNTLGIPTSVITEKGTGEKPKPPREHGGNNGLLYRSTHLPELSAPVLFSWKMFWPVSSWLFFLILTSIFWRTSWIPNFF